MAATMVNATVYDTKDLTKYISYTTDTAIKYIHKPDILIILKYIYCYKLSNFTCYVYNCPSGLMDKALAS